MILYKI